MYEVCVCVWPRKKERGRYGEHTHAFNIGICTKSGREGAGTRKGRPAWRGLRRSSVLKVNPSNRSLACFGNSIALPSSE